MRELNIAPEEYIVEATGLNLRSEPAVRLDTRIVTLLHGHKVIKIGETNKPEWWRVKTTFNGEPLEGFVANKWLVLLNEFVDLPVQPKNKLEIHMRMDHPEAKRSNNSHRAFPISEPDHPKRTKAISNKKVEQIMEIIEWLDVEISPRYKAGGGNTYCNIYAYDYCYFAGVYLPRVWWTEKALRSLFDNQVVQPQYGVTLREMNANSLYNWLEDFADDFGWRRSFELTELQSAANEGQVCIICAQRKELNRPGHIVAVVPEGKSDKADRENGNVTRPLESQAGTKNYKYTTKLSKWWAANKFGQFGFWIHD